MSSSSSPPAVPPELKPITPYLARAHELNTADPVIAYWCTSASFLSSLEVMGLISLRSCLSTGTYFAVQQAMTLGAKEADSQMFLFGIMDKLEAVSLPLFSPPHLSSDAISLSLCLCLES
jgi:vacuolar protein sorting-associated protein VTA1